MAAVDSYVDYVAVTVSPIYITIYHLISFSTYTVIDDQGSHYPTRCGLPCVNPTFTNGLPAPGEVSRSVYSQGNIQALPRKPQM